MARAKKNTAKIRIEGLADSGRPSTRGGEAPPTGAGSSRLWAGKPVRIGKNWGVLRHPPMGALCVVPLFLFFIDISLKLIKIHTMATKTKVAKKIPYQVQIDEDLLTEARKKASSEDLKLSQVIRRFLMDYVHNPQGKLFG